MANPSQFLLNSSKLCGDANSALVAAAVGGGSVAVAGGGGRYGGGALPRPGSASQLRLLRLVP